MIIRIQETSGDLSLEIPYRTLSDVVTELKINRGYFVEDRKGRKTWVPLHRVDFVREEDE